MARFPRLGRPARDVATAVADDTVTPVADKQTAAQAVAPASDEKSSSDMPTQDAQRGVQDVEAVTLTWTRTSLIGVFILMFLLYFVNAFQATILSNLVPFVTSDFQAHSLLTIIYIVADAMNAAMYIPLAKILDLWGRAEGFLIMTVFATLGLILMAVSHNLATFCAAQVFYQIGFGGMTYCIDVITADVTKLKNRGLAYAFTSSPYMITAFAGAEAAEDFYEKISWRWAFGCFAIILPFVASPLYLLLKSQLKKAQKAGLVIKEKSGRTAWESVRHYFFEFDAIGVFLFASGLTIFLLPFTLATSAPNGWSTGYIIAMIVLGFCLLVTFGVYEIRFAPVPFLKYEQLANRTVAGACLLSAVYQISYYCWASYFTSFLQVVNDVSMSKAGYISNTFNVVSGVLLLLVGWSIRKTCRFKWCLYYAVPLHIFTQGLMIYFRKPNQNVGFLVMCQVFISISGSTFIVVQQLAVLAAVDHQHVAATLALLYVVGTTGGAIGNTISGAIWTNTFPKALSWWLPESELANLDMIVYDLETQLSYEVGSPTRLAIQQAYGYAQTRMLAAGTGIVALAIIFTFMIKNINLAKVHQTKGVVF